MTSPSSFVVVKWAVPMVSVVSHSRRSWIPLFLYQGPEFLEIVQEEPVAITSSVEQIVFRCIP